MTSTSNTTVNTASPSASRVVQICLALLLLTAAGLKTHQLATEPVLGNGFFESRTFLLLVVEYECLLAFWLISGMFARVAGWVALATFSLFAIVATAQAMSGELSCGCFGRVQTSPFVSLSLDLAIVLLLLFCLGSSGAFPCRHGRSDRPPRAVCERADRSVGVFPRCVVGLWVLVATAVGIAGSRSPVGDAGPLVSVGRGLGRAIVVRPERMKGHPFGLGQYIDIGERLARGRWLVVLYRAGCPECDSLLRQWPLAGGEFVAERSCTAFVAVPSTAASHIPAVPGSVRGTLTDEVNWLFTPPVIVTLDNNTVLDVRSQRT